MRLFRSLAAIVALSVATPALAEDLGPLLDSMLDGCSFSADLNAIVEALPDAAPKGAAVPVPAIYASSAGVPYLFSDGEYSYWRLPLVGQWRGLQVAGVERIGIDETGVYAIIVSFAEGRAAVEASLSAPVAASQAKLDQDEFGEGLDHQTGIGEALGSASLYCDLST